VPSFRLTLRRVSRLSAYILVNEIGRLSAAQLLLESPIFDFLLFTIRKSEAYGILEIAGTTINTIPKDFKATKEVNLEWENRSDMVLKSVLTVRQRLNTIPETFHNQKSEFEIGNLEWRLNSPSTALLDHFLPCNSSPANYELQQNTF